MPRLRFLLPAGFIEQLDGDPAGPALETLASSGAAGHAAAVGALAAACCQPPGSGALGVHELLSRLGVVAAAHMQA